MAYTNLGYLHERGLGVDKNLTKAKEFYEEAIARETSAPSAAALAMNHLAHMYLEGRGVEKNEAKFGTWLKRSADLGNDNAAYTLAQLYINGENGFPQDVEKGRYYMERSASSGYIHAFAFLGLMHRKGLGFEKDLKRAYEILLYVLNQDASHPVANYEMGNLYYNGEHLEQNPSIALKHYLVACKKDYLPALINSAYMYENGDGTEVNLQEAVRFYKRAAKYGHEYAIERLEVLEK